jgi:hypothetical protein
VCGLLAFGAQTMTDADRAALAELSRVPERRLVECLLDAEDWAEYEFPDLAVASPTRTRLLDRFGQYGIWLACQLIREGVEDGDVLREELVARSGLIELRDVVLSHFGNRALLIKLQTALRKGRGETFAVRQSHDGPIRDAAEVAGGVLEALDTGVPAFEEFALLRHYYHDRDALGLRDGEAAELLRVTGEHGTALALRLGLDARALPGEMIPVAQRRLAHWRARGTEFGADRQTVTAARVLAGAYERMLYHAREAHRHLELDQ